MKKARPKLASDRDMTNGDPGVPSSPKKRLPGWLAPACALALAAACDDHPRPVEPPPPAPAEAGLAETEPAPPVVRAEPVDARPPPMHQPVPLWQDGATERQVDAADASSEGYLVVDLGDAWTPYLFSERGNEEEERVPNAYRATYLALANEEPLDDLHGERAERDKYLELYGIAPTLGVLRRRFREVDALECAARLDLEPLAAFDGFLAYRSAPQARAQARAFETLERQVRRLVEAQGVDDVASLDRDALDERDAYRVRRFERDSAEAFAVRAAQARLSCEGFFAGKPEHTPGAFDWVTHEALAEFERRHRVYGWGFLGGETLERLRQSPAELEREAVLRVLTERAMHAAGVIEDGSGPGDEASTFLGRDGERHPIPNLEAQIREHVVEAFGLHTPGSTLAWLEALGELPREREMLVALPAPPLPEYYSGDMELAVEIDRGDVWYEFPFDEEGRQRSQPMTRRPRTTLYAKYNGERIALATFGTTIGGWRTESVDGTIMWKYKNSPVGARVWNQIVAAPVWLPPASTPARDLLTRVRGRGLQVNYHETGPSYASAYGLVAAYHRVYFPAEDGSIRLGGDQGIRSHGSVDYMSIMRRHSHGCHRLHNHIAVRLMSYVLAHRRHEREGQQSLGFRLPLEHEGRDYVVSIDEGGYVFRLERPLPVEVLEGRIMGDRRTPIEEPLPRYDSEVGAYVTPDGQTVRIDRLGNVTPYELPAEATTQADGEGAAPGSPGEPAPSPTLEALLGDPLPAPVAPAAPSAAETGD